MWDALSTFDVRLYFLLQYHAIYAATNVYLKLVYLTETLRKINTEKYVDWSASGALFMRSCECHLVFISRIAKQRGK